ncbi:MAG TPA: hypothetical protein VGA37_13710 [Gemmatimonadales bacterium]
MATSAVAAQDKPAARQIAEAVSALPAPMRDGAAVLGYRDGALVTLRGGSNGMECLADDPAEEGLHVACYHESLAPFMARGRALKAEGKNTAEIKAMREAEIAAGALPMPERAAVLYSITGDDDAFDGTTGELNGSGLYVLYVPYATEATLGISTRPAVDRPWLMEAGKPWAHVMIRR